MDRAAPTKPPEGRLELPARLVPLFVPPYLRIRASYGGRGSAKTRSFATMAAVRALSLSAQGKRGVIICAREFQNSLRDSSFAEVGRAIEATSWLAPHFTITRHQIETTDGRIRFVFSGLRHSLSSIKSIADIHLVWVDEAEPVTEHAWQTLFPTVRAPGSEVWVTWNPLDPDSATNQRFRELEPARGMSVAMNYSDNPWFTGTLEGDRLADLKRLDPGTYAHVWEGAYLEHSDAQVFRRTVVRDFEPASDWDGPYYGADWGFIDPTVLVRVWRYAECLYIEYEAGGVGLDITQTVQQFREVPGADRARIRADSARPETINELRKHGLDVVPVAKWAGSLHDGIAHLQSYRQIVIHSRCARARDEARLYRYRTNQAGDRIMDQPIDAYNHVWDAARYALEPVIRARPRVGVILHG